MVGDGQVRTQVATQLDCNTGTEPICVMLSKPEGS
jgi:hypothetical protein